jgi:hypothetical protein
MRHWIMLLAVLSLAAVVLADAREDVMEKVLANPPATGLFLTFLAPDGQAYGAGLREGDILFSYAGEPTPDMAALAKLIPAKAGEAAVGLRYVREDAERTVVVKGGRLGLLGMGVEKGKPVVRHPETAYTPNFGALKPGDTFYNFVMNGEKAGFERHRLTPTADGFEMDRVVRFKLGDMAQSLHMRQKLSRGKYLALQSMEFTAGDEPLAKVERQGAALIGKAAGEGGDRAVNTPVPADLIPSYALDFAALTMPRQVGACLYFSELNEGEVSISGHHELYCAAKETIQVGGKAVEAYRYDASRFGTVTNRYWITADDRLVKADYTGPTGELTTQDDALRNLPAGVSAAL